MPNVQTLRKFLLLFVIVIFAIASSGCSNASILFPNGRFEKIDLKINDFSYYQAVKLNDNELLFFICDYDKQYTTVKLYKIKERVLIDLKSKMNIPRKSFQALKYNNNNVLLLGGVCSNEDYSSCGNLAEVYNIKENKFKKIANSNFKYIFDSRVSNIKLFLLKDGRVFIIDKNLVEIFNPNQEKFEKIGTPKEYLVQRMYSKDIRKEYIYMNHYYDDNDAILLDDGRVLIVGTYYNDTYKGRIEYKDALTEYFDYRSNKFVSLSTSDNLLWSPSLVKMNNGNILLVDKLLNGKGVMQIFDTTKNEYLTPIYTRKGFRSTRGIALENGKILFVGGVLWHNPDISFSKGLVSALYDPNRNVLKILKTKYNPKLYGRELFHISKNKVFIKFYGSKTTPAIYFY